MRAPVRAPNDCLRAFYGPKLVGSPCLKVVYATQNVVRVRATCRAITVSALTGPVNLPGASCRGSQVLWFLWALYRHHTDPYYSDHMMSQARTASTRACTIPEGAFYRARMVHKAVITSRMHVTTALQEYDFVRTFHGPQIPTSPQVYGPETTRMSHITLALDVICHTNPYSACTGTLRNSLGYAYSIFRSCGQRTCREPIERPYTCNQNITCWWRYTDFQRATVPYGSLKVRVT